jgi:hypothetical protein
MRTLFRSLRFAHHHGIPMLLMMTTRMKQSIARKRKESVGYYPTGMTIQTNENAAGSLLVMKIRIPTIPPRRGLSGSGERVLRTARTIQTMLRRESERRGRAGEMVQMTMKRL